jgi:hypothetical protein
MMEILVPVVCELLIVSAGILAAAVLVQVWAS